MQTSDSESTLCLLLRVSGHFWVDSIYIFESDGCSFGYICIQKIQFIPWIILEILDFHKFFNLIGQEHTQMYKIPFNWKLWNNLLSLWISIKRHLTLFYCFEVFWARPAVPDQVQLIISMDVYTHKKISFMLQLFHEISDFQESCNLISQEDLWKQKKP